MFGVDQRVWIHRRHGFIQHPIERADQGVVVAIGEVSVKAWSAGVGVRGLSAKDSAWWHGTTP